MLESYGVSKAKGKDFLSNPFVKKIQRPENYNPDFPEGLEIQEYVDGRAVKDGWGWIKLIGNMLPQVPFNYGGKQRIVKEYYPGNSEPVTHVLGPEENSMTIRGRLYDKKYHDPELRGVAYEVAKQLDAMRIRGNMIRLTLGDWQRYGFIEELKIDLKTLSDMNYEITFSIIGFNKPINYQKVYESGVVPVTINQALIALAEQFQEEYSTIPEEMPVSIADIIQDGVNVVSGAISNVTDYIDTVVSAAEDISNVINRAIGVIRYAQIACIKFKDRLGRISINNDLGPLISGTDSEKMPRKYTASSFIFNAQGETNDLSDYLAKLKAQFEAIQDTAPLARYRTVEGDSLQKIAIKFYNDASKWETIYEHNNLDSTELEVGLFLEIPRL